jgi:hypothetical protein
MKTCKVVIVKLDKMSFCWCCASWSCCCCSMQMTTKIFFAGPFSQGQGEYIQLWVYFSLSINFPISYSPWQDLCAISPAAS